MKSTKGCTHSKANHGHTTHKELICLGKTNAAGCSEYTIFSLRLRLWCLNQEMGTFNQTRKTNAKLLTKNQPFKSLFSFLKLEKKIKTFLAGALVLDLKRANVLNLGDKEDDEEEEEEVWTGGSKRWVNGFGFSNGSLFKLNE